MTSAENGMSSIFAGRGCSHALLRVALGNVLAKRCETVSGSVEWTWFNRIWAAKALKTASS